METVRVQIDFSPQRDAELGASGGAILARMTGNDAFTDLADDVAMVQEAHVSYIQALAAGGPKAGALANAIKNDCRKALELALHDLGMKINRKANGSLVLLESTGYPLVRFAGRKGKKDIDLAVGTGRIAVTLKAVANAGIYLVQYTDAPVTEDSVWRQVMARKSVTTIEGLETGRKYAVRFAAVVDDRLPVFSDPAVSKHVE